ncbi:CCDC12/cwf18 family protein [Aspergillus tanneri]|uniref:Uncharacterized protein n=1 Tax=Aspergillus tanneri TaxID=1220188 RepID=A0A5M9N580_9EURO|nr:uncharacterized protein ATNIH1004_001103 [Aspergillus tanneri]KAA8652199.1 hypothetical protein ATNIH1004_001103 [Aspergillus tanneri]
MASTHASLDAAAAERKARLAKLASLKRKKPESEPQAEAQAQDEMKEDTFDEVATKYLSGRNYDAETRGPKLGFDQSPLDGQATLEAQAAEIAKATAEQAKKDDEGGPADRSIQATAQEAQLGSQTGS